ncbi:hypothetical protein ASG90_11590 [Nocardioides sp. Soil797]|nr:hypothetical protein ASG90_11590 [Nocardioides sp. Soil797]
MTYLLWSVVALLGASIATVVLLLVLRVTSGWRSTRHAREHAEGRELVLTLAMGEEDEVEAAVRTIAQLRGSEWDRVEHQVFALLPKVRGETRERLVDLVRERGAAQRARRLAHSRSAVVRCRGAHRLGALRDHSDGPLVLTLLHDRNFLVRRVALRALGSLGDAAHVTAVVACGDDPAMTRDVVSALQRMGIGAAPELRRVVADALDRAEPLDDGEERVVGVAVFALGLIGDPAAVPMLVRALTAGEASIRVRASAALGAIGAPRAVPALMDALDDAEAPLCEAIARALGEIGDDRAAPGLGRALETSPRLASRAIAGALLRLGGPGLEHLRGHSSPYAAEALAVDALRSAAR